MAVTIVKVLALLATVLGVAISAWALTICAALLFTRKTDAALAALKQSWGKCLAVGFFTTFALLFISTALMSVQLPIAKLAGLLGYTITLTVAAIGSAGMATLVANRIMRHDPGVCAYSALTRGAGLLVAAAAFPVLGFFVIAPLLVMLSVGAGTKALLSRTQPDTAADMGGA